MTPMNIVQFSRAPPPLSIYVQNSSIPLTLDVQFQTNPHPSPNDNQSIKRTHNPRIPFFTSFHLAEASPSTFSSLYTLVCAVVLKYHKMYFIYNYSHFWYSFCNQPVLLAQLENVNKLWNNNHAHRNQNKNKTKLRHFQIDHALYWSIQPTNNAMVSLKDGFTV